MKVTTEYPTYSRMISFTCAIACPAGASSASATSSKRRNSSHIISFRSLDLFGLSSKSKFTVAAKDTDFEHLGHCFNILESSSCITMPFCLLYSYPACPAAVEACPAALKATCETP